MDGREATDELESFPLPGWVRRIALPLWVSGPDRRILFLNRHAEELFGCAATACVGQTCFALVSARKPDGSTFCAPRCPRVVSADHRTELAPQTLQVRARNGTVHWVRMLTIPLEHEGAPPSLVELAMPSDRERGMAEFFAQVLARSTPARNGNTRGALRVLTPREREVLMHLAHDEELPAIARKLHISHVTVRNHVQHILARLGVHSTLEAVAVALLDEHGE